MSIELIVASVAITCALVLYTFPECSGASFGNVVAAPCAAVLGRPRVRYHRHDDHVEHRAAIVRRRIRDPRSPVCLLSC